ncbi:MAG: hypothetical protein C4293_17325 [Nitrospiraceae bacterium]
MNGQGYEIAHALPGRIRLKISRLKQDSSLGRAIEERFSSVPGIERVEANTTTGSLLVLYDQERIGGIDSLLALSETFRSLFPDIDVHTEELQDLLWAQFGNGSKPRPSLGTDVSAYFASLNVHLARATGGLDFNIVLPVALFVLGIRGILLSEKIPFPAWYDFLWFSFATFHMLNRPPTEASSPIDD